MIVSANIPKNMTPVAIMLVKVVPSRVVMKPPRSGVQVLFNESAAINKLNSVLDAPSSFSSRVFSGPRIYDAL